MRTRTLLIFVGLVVAPAFAVAAPVNVNQADAATIAGSLDGIGPLTARAIVQYREKNGPFKRKEDLLKVKGMGAKVLRANDADILLHE